MRESRTSISSRAIHVDAARTFRPFGSSSRRPDDEDRNCSRPLRRLTEVRESVSPPGYGPSMGKRNRQRRAEKAKQRAKEHAGRRHRSSLPPPWEPTLTQAERARMALMGAVDARLRGDTGGEGRFTHALATHDQRLVAREAEDELRRALPRLWDAGWQPAELVRHARRSSARCGRLIATAVLVDHAPRTRATLHPRWAAQVDELAATTDAVRLATGWLHDLVRRENLQGEAVVATVVHALAACLGVGPLATLLAPPGTSPAGMSRPGPTTAVDDAVLAKVRALLAQAESTTFEAEAATFTAKAQELMARHAIDHALVWERAGRGEAPVTIRLPVDDPYADKKSLLLHIVAEASRCRSVFHERYAMSSIIGFAPDVAAAEVLFTSLLVQSQVALQAESARAPAGSRPRSRSFRSSFLLAYAQRIAERLSVVNEQVVADADAEHGDSLLPVLAARDSVVDDAVADQFGELRSSPVRGASDAVGWARGRLAADRAQLAFGDLDDEAPPARPTHEQDELPLATSA